MKRYRFLVFYIDSTRNIFKSNVAGPLLDKLKEEHRSYLEDRYGVQNFETKFIRWISIPKPVLSVIDEHTHLFQDIEDAYVLGSLYSSLTSACCLGERIFNQIILRVKDSYHSHPNYKKVYNKDTINDWNIGIETLRLWNIIDDNTEKRYRKLYRLRTDAVHFQNKHQDLEKMAREAIELINQIVFDLFGIGPEKKFINWCKVPGEIYLRKGFEIFPFIKEFFLPNARFVGYKHTVESILGSKWLIRDDEQYSAEEITDEEFVLLRNKHNKNC